MSRRKEHPPAAVHAVHADRDAITLIIAYPSDTEDQGAGKYMRQFGGQWKKVA